MEIKATDLRIGNYIFSELKSNRNDGITIVDLSFLEQFDEVKSWGVPITEEELIWCGFKKCGHYFEIKTKFTDLDSIAINLELKSVFLCKNEEDIELKNYTYIHQLQNLYFALVGVELNFN